MANRIVELTREPIGHGLVALNVIYLYPVSPVIEVNGTPVILHKRSELPEDVEELGALTPTELTQIDAGVGTWFSDKVEQRKGEALSAVLARAQTRYAKGLERIELLRTAYEHFGDRHNEG